jgi:hypothetical protein
MFFQDSSPGADKPEAEKFDIDAVRKGLDKLSGQILSTFTQGRQRVTEFQQSITDVLPQVRAFGVDLPNLGKQIEGIAIASRRNVIENTENIREMVAASKLLNISAGELSTAFMNVGVGIGEMGDSLEDSINYVRSIGANAKQVMKDVTDNMAQMNRFQFEGGVQGLTKMAAQASLLRFDMKQTFQLAERVISPEGAIDVAAAFQRLGVAAGNLVDPFALMNASINDPGELQDSLVDVAKQFTYFDEKTKTFKINPQGVLTLREIEQQTNVSAAEMSKLGLAAAELDERLSQISPSLKFENEEDKQYLANIGRMGKGGEYEVKIKGQEDYVKLGELNQEQLDELIDEQKNGPKTLEDLAKAQLSIDELSSSYLASINYSLLGGVLTDKNIQNIIEGARTGVDVVGDATTGRLTTENGKNRIREISEGKTGDIANNEEIQAKIASGDIMGALKELTNVAGGNVKELGSEALKLFGDIGSDIKKKLEEKGGFAAGMADKAELMLSKFATNFDTKPDGTGGTMTEDDFWTNITADKMSGANRNLGTVEGQVREQKSLIELLGEIKVNVNFQDLPTGLSSEQKEQISKTISDKLNEDKFKDYIVRVTRPDNVFRGGGASTY